MIASSLSRTIFEIKATGEKTNISTTMLSGSGKNTLSFVSLDASAFPKISGCWFAAYSSTNVSVRFKFVSLTGGIGFEALPEIKTYYISFTVTANIILSYKGKRGEKTVIEDVEYDVDELPDSDFA